MEMQSADDRPADEAQQITTLQHIHLPLTGPTHVSKTNHSIVPPASSRGQEKATLQYWHGNNFFGHALRRLC